MSMALDIIDITIIKMHIKDFINTNSQEIFQYDT